MQQMQITTPLAVQQADVSKALFDAIGGPDAANGLLTPSQIGAFGTVIGGDTARLYTGTATGARPYRRSISTRSATMSG